MSGTIFSNFESTEISSETRTKTAEPSAVSSQSEIWSKEECKKLAKDPKTPTKILFALLDHESFLIRRLVAQNPNSPSNFLALLANDSSPSVRIAVAENSNTHIYTLMSLAKDDEWEVRASVAQNPNTPQEILVELAQDENEYVKEYAISKIPLYTVDDSEFDYTDDDDWENWT